MGLDYTFLLGAGGGKVLVLHFDWWSVTLHSAEKGTPRSRAEPRWTRSDVSLHWETSCGHTHAHTLKQLTTLIIIMIFLSYCLWERLVASSGTAASVIYFSHTCGRATLIAVINSDVITFSIDKALSRCRVRGWQLFFDLGNVLRVEVVKEALTNQIILREDTKKNTK